MSWIPILKALWCLARCTSLCVPSPLLESIEGDGRVLGVLGCGMENCCDMAQEAGGTENPATGQLIFCQSLQQPLHCLNATLSPYTFPKVVIAILVGPGLLRRESGALSWLNVAVQCHPFPLGRLFTYLKAFGKNVLKPHTLPEANHLVAAQPGFTPRPCDCRAHALLPGTSTDYTCKM